MSELDIAELDWAKMDNLIPAVIQDKHSAQVLMLGYVSKESLTETINSKRVTFYSRSKNRLWMKGETSGNTLSVETILPDCDLDSVLIQVTPKGPTCHLGSVSCFGEASTPPLAILAQLEDTIEARRSASPDESYTAKLLQGDVKRLAQKVGEEGVEVSLAAATGNTQECLQECADLMYHLLVLLAQMNCHFSDVAQVLQARHQ